MNTKNTKLYEALTFRMVIPDDHCSLIILGNASIEFLIKKLIVTHTPSLKKLSEKLPHSKRLELAHGLGIITDEQKGALISTNKLRNKAAHEIADEFPNELWNSMYDQIKKAFPLLANFNDDNPRNLLRRINYNLCHTLSKLEEDSIYDADDTMTLYQE